MATAIIRERYYDNNENGFWMDVWIEKLAFPDGKHTL